MSRLAERVSTWLSWAACICLIVLMVITFVDVVGRFFDVPLKFAVEIIQIGMGLLVFFGLSITTLRRGHIAVDLLSDFLSPVLQNLLMRFTALVAVVFIGLMAWRLWDRAGNFRSDGLVTDILAIPVWPSVSIMALVALLASLIAVLQVIKPEKNTDETGAAGMREVD